jgi:hypothetical protein
VRKRFGLRRYKCGSLPLDQWSQQECMDVDKIGFGLWYDLDCPRQFNKGWTWFPKIPRCGSISGITFVGLVPLMVTFVRWTEFWNEMAILSWVCSRQFNSNERYKWYNVLEILT